MPNQEIINFANQLADISGEIIRKYFRKNLSEEKKDNQTPVTKADREAELAMREAIIKQFPDHGIIGEEFGNLNPNAKYKWVLDPIDGTISFVMGRPIFGTLIALCENNKPVLGIINQPINGERWVGEKSAVGSRQSAVFNGKEIQTSNCQNLSEAILCATSPFFFQGKDSEILKRISSKTKYQSQGGIIYGGDCYLFGLLAMGKVDIVIENGLKNFDFIALVPVVEGAGGVITDWNGNELNENSDGTVIACANRDLHEQILKLIKG